ncbi:hypothetical protein ACFVX3_32660 [Rhodococcus erythropolis]
MRDKHSLDECGAPMMMSTGERSRRRWNLAQRVFFGICVGAVVVLLACIPLRHLVAGWMWGACIGIAVLSGISCSIANDKYRAGGFVGVHTSIGRVTVVDVPSPEAESASSVIFFIDAALPDGTMLHRRLTLTGCADPFGWIGYRVYFRHATFDADDLDDAFFGREEFRRTLERTNGE